MAAAANMSIYTNENILTPKVMEFISPTKVVVANALEHLNAESPRNPDYSYGDIVSFGNSWNTYNLRTALPLAPVDGEVSTGERFKGVLSTLFIGQGVMRFKELYNRIQGAKTEINHVVQFREHLNGCDEYTANNNVAYVQLQRIADLKENLFTTIRREAARDLALLIGVVAGSAFLLLGALFGSVAFATIGILGIAGWAIGTYAPNRDSEAAHLRYAHEMNRAIKDLPIPEEDEVEEEIIAPPTEDPAATSTADGSGGEVAEPSTTEDPAVADGNGGEVAPPTAEDPAVADGNGGEVAPPTAEDPAVADGSGGEVAPPTAEDPAVADGNGGEVAEPLPEETPTEDPATQGVSSPQSSTTDSTGNNNDWQKVD